jgi:hypothetical protein
MSPLSETGNVPIFSVLSVEMPAELDYKGTFEMNP